MAWNSVKEKKTEQRKSSAAKVEQLHPSDQDNPSDTAAPDKPKSDSAKEKAKDLDSGMELLEPNFLLSVIENTKGNDANDVAMRKFTFNELLRRKNQNQIDSYALKVYALDAGNLYGKTIQCEAIKELTKRTS